MIILHGRTADADGADHHAVSVDDGESAGKGDEPVIRCSMP
jgi:hypothetical protein